MDYMCNEKKTYWFFIINFINLTTILKNEVQKRKPRNYSYIRIYEVHNKMKYKTYRAVGTISNSKP